jgi:hypothetical protein
VLGEGPRARLDDADGTELSQLIKAELVKEIKSPKDGVDIVGGTVGTTCENNGERLKALASINPISCRYLQ